MGAPYIARNAIAAQASSQARVEHKQRLSEQAALSYATGLGRVEERRLSVDMVRELLERIAIVLPLEGVNVPAMETASTEVAKNRSLVVIR